MSMNELEVLQTTITALAVRASALDDEQSVRGLDALSELQLHALTEDAFVHDGFGVHREAFYPSDGDAYTNANHRQRCDFALTPNPGLKLHDPVHEMRQLAMAQDTLFAQVLQSGRNLPTACPPEDAWWIEIKSCSQHAYRDGIPSPNPSYAHELVTGLQTDICKLSADPQIWHGCVLAVLFTESEEIATHDLNQAARICLDQNLPVRSPIIACRSITDRAGNGCVTVGLFPVSI
ncbi:MAG: hypothetical protein JKY43_00585 [Phycisphaerales bacterium]|nr:hypothetical protein [Phycisphaerales bacterium]